MAGLFACISFVFLTRLSFLFGHTFTGTQLGHKTRCQCIPACCGLCYTPLSSVYYNYIMLLFAIFKDGAGNVFISCINFVYSCIFQICVGYLP